MTNSIERHRIEATDEAQGGWVSFDWANGTMFAEWDDGQTETWGRRGYAIETKAKSFFLFTEQWDRFNQVNA